MVSISNSLLRRSEINNVTGIGNPWMPTPGHLNAMTINMIKNKDNDGDKALGAEELDVPEDVFSKIDANGDGNADRVELNDYYPVSKIDIPTLHLIKDKDDDGDNVMSAEELDISEDIFKAIDANGDGSADREELNAASPLNKLYNMSNFPFPVEEVNDDGVDVII